jgi:hypothetical protein
LDEGSLYRKKWYKNKKTYPDKTPTSDASRMTGGKVVLITGCSSGVGYSTSLYLARRGFRVYSTMRKLSKAGPILEAKKRVIGLHLLKLDCWCVS